ncbi:hypothetical protein LSAT2_021705 [Lamellibrachia satsuma]|nr:hypothetical protein LSAT2_021705 [Lamellibrachia satsuma]
MPCYTKYPATILKGKAIQRAVTAHLLAPVQASGDHVFPFRVIWRVDDNQLTQAWDAIVSQRLLCDQVVAQLPSLQMFVSCISGVYSRAGGSEAGAGPVYPAVMYWAVFRDFPPNGCCEVSSRIWPVCPAVQVKPITSLSRPRAAETFGVNCRPLFIVLKDHSGLFVSQKIARSLQVSGIDSHQSNAAKLVVMSHSKYLQMLPACVAALQDAGLNLEADVVKDTVIE